VLPEEIYASGAHSEKFKYSHPLSHMPVNDGSVRARLAYDLMNFMKRSDCHYFINSETMEGYDPSSSDDEVDIMIVDGFYREAEMLVDHILEKDDDNEKALFQKAFIQHLKQEYEKLLEREDNVLKADPKNINALLNKGFALTNLNREKEALIVANHALRIDPENLDILSNKAYIEKLLGFDALREKTLVLVYNVSAKRRMEILEEQESKLLEDMDSIFMHSDFTDSAAHVFREVHSPSAFEAFNQRSGFNQSTAVH